MTFESVFFLEGIIDFLMLLEKRMARTAPAAIASGEEKSLEAPKGVSEQEFQALMKHLDRLELEDEEEMEKDEDNE